MRKRDLHVPIDRVAAVLGLLVVSGLLVAQVNGVRAAFTEFKYWWAFPQPMFVGDDYIEATVYADGKKRWPAHFRSITVGMAAKRLAGVRRYRLVVPEPLAQLWTTPDGVISAPPLDDLFPAVDGGNVKSVRFDPHVDDETLRRWRAEGRIEPLQWQVEIVDDGERHHDSITLLTDKRGFTMYAVPSSLLSKGMP